MGFGKSLEPAVKEITNLEASQIDPYSPENFVELSGRIRFKIIDF